MYSPKTTMYRKVHQVSSKVDQLAKEVESTIGTQILRKRFNVVDSSGANNVQYHALDAISKTSLSIGINSLKMFDPDTPATPIIVDGNNTPFEDPFIYPTIHGSLLLRNNNVIPVKVRLYLLHCKTNHSESVFNTIKDGLQLASPDTTAVMTNPLLFPTDSAEFMQKWSIKESWNFVLNPGQEQSRSMTRKNVMYDPNVADGVGEEFTQEHKSTVWLIRFHGVASQLAQTNGNSLHNYGEGHLCVEFNDTMTLKYEAGIGLKYIRLIDPNVSQTTASQVTQRDLVTANRVNFDI